jgi:hypothetical protein
MHREATDHLMGRRSPFVEEPVELAECDMDLTDDRSLGLAETSSAHRAHFAQTTRKGPSF